MTEQNTLSISELQQQADASNAQAQLDLAWRYLRNDKDKETALMWLNKAAEQGLAGGQLALGLYYFQGINKDLVNKAKTSLFADENTALTGVIVMHLKDGKDAGLAFTWFKKAAEQHCAEAQYLLAVCYRDGIGVKQNDQLAFAWFGKAAEQGFAAAQCSLARSYHEGKGVEQNNERALAWLNKAVEQTDAYIADVDLCEPSILQHCQKVSLEHSKCAPEAYLLLGERYAQGKGVEQCDETAFKWYQKAAEMNVAEAQYRLALGYFEGKNVEKDCGLGMKWLREAVIQNHEAANAWLENAYLRLAFPHLVDKENAEKDYQFAFDWCSKEAEQDSAEAYLCLGILYLFGKGVERNDERAFECFSKADNLYDCDSDKNGELYFIICLILGICYAQGKGISKDISKAERCFGYGNDDKRRNEYGAGQALVEGKVETVSNGYSIQVVPIPSLILVSLLMNHKNDESGSEIKFVEETCMDRYMKNLFLIAAEELRKKNRILERKDKELVEKDKELNNLIAMFAHNFLGTLQCIRSNAEHDNNPTIHLKTVKMMGGALTAFSILSADDDKLVEQLKQDNVGEINLQQNLANNLALAISQLLGKTNKDKIVNLYLQHLRKTKRIGIETSSEELRINKDYRKMWQTLQHQWEDEFNALFSEHVELPLLQKWLTDNFFPVEITGFDSHNISFREYGITDSIFLIVFMEIFVNAFKYMDVSKNEPLTLMLCEENQCYKLVCENPSTQETGRGTHKGMDFLKTIAKKLGGQFITEVTINSFKSTFTIPSELLK
ncbi:MAG: hypothetical protein NTY50_13005 [Methylobacter sp.]|nr:hypothetical protein [Methylobacter sp.]